MATALAVALLLAAGGFPYSRYESIVQRQMFGPLPEGFDPTKSPSEVSRSQSRGGDAAALTKEQEKVKSAIRFSVINVTPEGHTAIGFTDSSDPKNPVHYYLRVGESRNGWEVKEADAKTASMTIAKDGIEVSLTLGGDSAKTEGATAKAGAPAQSARRQSPLLGGSLGARRRLRREQEMMEDEKRRQEISRQTADLEAKRQAFQAQQEERDAALERDRDEMRSKLSEITRHLRETRELRERMRDEQPPQDENQQPDEE